MLFELVPELFEPPPDRIPVFFLLPLVLVSGISIKPP
jgi:hypothetical protein